MRKLEFCKTQFSTQKYYTAIKIGCFYLLDVTSAFKSTRIFLGWTGIPNKPDVPYTTWIHHRLFYNHVLFHKKTLVLAAVLWLPEWSYLLYKRLCSPSPRTNPKEMRSLFNARTAPCRRLSTLIGNRASWKQRTGVSARSAEAAPHPHFLSGDRKSVV